MRLVLLPPLHQCVVQRLCVKGGGGERWQRPFIYAFGAPFLAYVVGKRPPFLLLLLQSLE